jgi:hypothetical protein
MVTSISLFRPFQTGNMSNTDLSALCYRFHLDSVIGVTNSMTLQNNDAQIFQKSGGHFKIVDTTRVTYDKLHTEDAQIFGATVQMLSPRQPGARDLCTPGIHTLPPNLIKSITNS